MEAVAEATAAIHSRACGRSVAWLISSARLRLQAGTYSVAFSITAPFPRLQVDAAAAAKSAWTAARCLDVQAIGLACTPSFNKFLA